MHGNNTYCEVLNIGTMKIMIPRERNLYMSDVYILMVPTMKNNMSLKWMQMDFEIHFHSKMCWETL